MRLRTKDLYDEIRLPRLGITEREIVLQHWLESMTGSIMTTKHLYEKLHALWYIPRYIQSVAYVETKNIGIIRRFTNEAWRMASKRTDDNFKN